MAAATKRRDGNVRGRSGSLGRHRRLVRWSIASHDRNGSQREAGGTRRKKQARDAYQ